MINAETGEQFLHAPTPFRLARHIDDGCGNIS